jgi:hypothetical protein
MRSTNNWTSQLNFSWAQRLATVSALTFVGSLPLIAFLPSAGGVSMLALAGFVALNWRFFALIRRKRGLITAAATVPLHLTYSMVCIASLVAGLLYPAIELPPNRRLEPMDRVAGTKDS